MKQPPRSSENYHFEATRMHNRLDITHRRLQPCKQKILKRNLISWETFHTVWIFFWTTDFLAAHCPSHTPLPTWSGPGDHCTWSRCTSSILELHDARHDWECGITLYGQAQVQSLITLSLPGQMQPGPDVTLSEFSVEPKQNPGPQVSLGLLVKA